MLVVVGDRVVVVVRSAVVVVDLGAVVVAVGAVVVVVGPDVVVVVSGALVVVVGEGPADEPHPAAIAASAAGGKSAVGRCPILQPSPRLEADFYNSECAPIEAMSRVLSGKGPLSLAIPRRQVPSSMCPRCPRSPRGCDSPLSPRCECLGLA